MSRHHQTDFRSKPSSWLIWLIVLLLVGACSPDPIEVAVEVEVERAETCDDLVPTGEALAVQLLAAIDSTPIDVLTGDEPATGSLADLIDIGRDFDRKAARLGCDPSDLNDEIMNRVGDAVSPDSLAGSLLLELMRGGTAAPADG